MWLLEHAYPQPRQTRFPKRGYVTEVRLLRWSTLRQAHDAAEALLYVCRRLWGQPHVAPIYAMLLHQWLLLHKHAGGAEQRLKHLKVMVSGGCPARHHMPRQGLQGSNACSCLHGTISQCNYQSAACSRALPDQIVSIVQRANAWKISAGL